jgi:hypothetical protein
LITAPPLSGQKVVPPALYQKNEVLKEARQFPSDQNLNFVALNPCFITGNGLDGGHTEHSAARYIEASAVPGTFDGCASKFTFSKRTIIVSADIFDCVVLVIYVKDGHIMAAYFYDHAVAGGKFLSVCYGYEFGHQN